MQHRSLVVAMVVVGGAACGAFGATESPSEPVDGGGPDALVAADGGVPTDAMPDAARPGNVPSSGKLVFVAGARFTPGTNFSSAADADALCQDQARSGMLAGQYVAWVSDQASTPHARLGAGFRVWYLYDGTKAALESELEGNGIVSTINRRIDGTVTDSFLVWTGTQASGQLAINNCGLWTTSAGNLMGEVGSTQQNTKAWTSSNQQVCSAALPFYCFEK